MKNPAEQNQANVQYVQRFNMYQSVHKGLRAFMSDTLTLVGRTDWQDVLECEETALQLRSLLHICSQHLKHENDFLHTAMEQRSPGSAAQCAQEHVGHLQHIEALQRLLDQALAARDDNKAIAWVQLYHELSVFVAENLEHMLLEERDHNLTLWQHYSDAELHEIHDALLASIPADEMAVHFRWMLPQLSHAERVGMLSGMRQGMPEEVFASQLDLARPLLPARAWFKLQSAFKTMEVLHG